MSSLVFTQHIEVTPGVCGGKPRIAGHRIKVRDRLFWFSCVNFCYELKQANSLSRRC
ncbi:MAG: DUF433 domain-containing protein [Microcystis sp. M179S2]|nr:DUF433 domain-containing protein [Microcystis sp. M179S2]